MNSLLPPGFIVGCAECVEAKSVRFSPDESGNWWCALPEGWSASTLGDGCYLCSDECLSLHKKKATEKWAKDLYDEFVKENRLEKYMG
jgi:hypothetical protein